MIQHYVDLILLISTIHISYKDFKWTLVIAEQAFQKTVGLDKRPEIGSGSVSCKTRVEQEKRGLNV